MYIRYLESLIEKDNGYLITSKAVESGVSKPSVSKYVREHDMEKVAHGIYILDNVWLMSCLYSSNEIDNIIYSRRPPFICMVLSMRIQSYLFHCSYHRI